MNKAFEKILEFIDEQIKIEESIAKSENEGHPITHQYGANCMNVIKKFVQEVAEEYNGGWIPCSERLPSGLDFVLYTCKDGEVDICSIEYFYDYLDKFTAWQPLPSPFREIEVINHDD